MDGFTKKEGAVNNFLNLVQESLSPSNVLFIYDKQNEMLAQKIQCHNIKKKLIPNIEARPLDQISIPKLSEQRSLFDYVLFFYDIIPNEKNDNKWELRHLLDHYMDFVIPSLTNFSCNL